MLQSEMRELFLLPALHLAFRKPAKTVFPFFGTQVAYRKSVSGHKRPKFFSPIRRLRPARSPHQHHRGVRKTSIFVDKDIEELQPLLIPGRRSQERRSSFLNGVF